MGTTKTAWDFVEAHYPNYSSSDEIAENEDLSKLVNGFYEDGDDAHKLLLEEYGGEITNPQIKIDYNESLVKIYEEAIENYLNQ